MGKTKSILAVTTAEISDEELALLKQWCNGYVMALVVHNSLKDAWDEWCAFNEDWDVNFYRPNEGRTIKAVAYRVKMTASGFTELETSKWVEINSYNQHGKVKK